MAAAETQNPRRAIPMAARRISIRILLFYVLSIFMLTLVVASDDPNLLTSTGTAAQSPFVIAATNAGIKVIPSIMNAIILTSAWSSGNSSMLGGSRMLFGLALNGHAPIISLRLNRFGVPTVAVALFSTFICLGYMTLSATASTVFTWLQDLVSIATLVNWIAIWIVYPRFLYATKAQGSDRQAELPWAAPLQPYTTWGSLILFIILLLTGGYSTFAKGQWSDETFVSSYINIPIILILYFGYKLWHKTKIIPLVEVLIVGFIDAYNQEKELDPFVDPRVKEENKKGIQRFNILWS